MRNNRPAARGVALSCSAVGLGLALTACAHRPSPAIPENLAPGADESLLLVTPAKGVQIYQCRAKNDVPAQYEWAFVAPDAQLFDKQGALVGVHGAGPTWQANDGSKVVGKVKERADAPAAGAVPWLLLTTESTGPAGAFSNVTSIQRINTEGGVAPVSGCTGEKVGATARVQYTADYRFFVRK